MIKFAEKSLTLFIVANKADPFERILKLRERRPKSKKRYLGGLVDNQCRWTKHRRGEA